MAPLVAETGMYMLQRANSAVTKRVSDLISDTGIRLVQFLITAVNR